MSLRFGFVGYDAVFMIPPIASPRTAGQVSWQTWIEKDIEMKRHSLLRVMLTGTALLVAGGAAHAYTGEEFAKEAKVSLTSAKAIALRALPGQLADQELEKEPGGSGLRYSFDIKVAGVTHEVGVDAATGAVLENAVEGLHPD